MKSLPQDSDQNYDEMKKPGESGLKNQRKNNESGVCEKKE